MLSFPFVAALLVLSGSTLAQAAPQNTPEPSAPEPHTSHAGNREEAEQEPVAVVEFGAGTGWGFSGGPASFGSDFGAEITPVEQWLELESSVTTLFTHTSTEWDVDFLFKKPWTLSSKLEFMAGLGPEYAHLRSSGIRTNSISAELMTDFMVWPRPSHRFGWYLEPAYAIDLGHDHGQSIGLTTGLLIGIPHRARTRP